MSASIGFDIFARDRASGTFRKIGDNAKSLKGDVDTMGSGMGEAGTKMAGLMTKAGMVGPALMATAGALSAAASGGVAVAGALGPVAAGGMAVYAGALAAVKQGALVAKFAMKGVMEAAQGDKKAMKALSPAGRELARTFRDLQPDLEVVRKQAQAGLFPGVQDATTRLAKTYLPLLQTAARQTGNELGTLASNAGKLATSGPWQRDFATVTTLNAVNMGLMGQVGLNLANVARHLFVTALPLVGMFLNWAVSASRTVEAMTQAGRGSGALAAFWARAAESGRIFGGILGDLGGAIWNVFKIGNSSGGGVQLLGTVKELTQNFQDWTGSANGAKAIAVWFETGRQNLGAMSRLVTAVFGGMKGIGAGAMLTPLIDQITKQVIPPLMAFLKNASASGALPALVQTVGKIIAVFAKLAENDTSLKTFAVTLGKLADGAAWIIREVPGASKALGAFFIVAGTRSALKVAGLGGVVEGLTSMMVKLAKKVLVSTGVMAADTTATSTNTIAKRISTSTAGTWVGVKALELTAWVKSAAATVWSTATLVAHTVVTKTIMAATKAWAAVQWLLNAAMTANPIGLVVAAIGLLVGGLVLAYQKSETFRAIVDGAFTMLKTVVLVSLTAIQAAIGAAWTWITSKTTGTWDAIKSAVTAGVGAVVGFVRTHWPLLLAIVLGPLGLIVRYVIKHWSEIRERTAAAFDAVRDTIRTVLVAAQAVVQSMLDRIRDTFSRVFGTVRDVVSSGWSRIREVFTNSAEAIRDKVSDVWTRIREIFANSAGAVRDKVADVWARIREIFGNSAEAVRDKVSDVWARIREIFGSSGGAIRDKVSEIWARIREIFANAAGAIRESASNAWSNVREAFTNGVERVANVVGGLGRRVGNAVGDLGGVLRGAGQSIMRGLLDGIDDMMDALRRRLARVTGMIPNWKGPMSRDKTLLRPSGAAIMGGLMGGIDDQMRPLQRQLASVTNTIGAVGSSRLAGATALSAGAAALAAPRQAAMVAVAAGGQRLMGGGGGGVGRQTASSAPQIVEVHLHLDGRTIVQQVRAHKRNTGGAATGIG